MAYLMERLKESEGQGRVPERQRSWPGPKAALPRAPRMQPSTWRGAVMLAMGLGVGISPEQAAAIGVFAPDPRGKR